MTYRIYRVENLAANHGLWYNGDGSYNGFIHNKMKDAMLRDLPMGFDPDMVRGGRSWISAADSIEQLRNWVSPEDAVQLEEAGFELTVYDVLSYREVPGHIVFLRSDVVGCHTLPFEVLNYERAAEVVVEDQNRSETRCSRRAPE